MTKLIRLTVLTSLFSLLLTTLHAQKQIVGKVLEQRTNHPIPYTNIGIVNSNVGTISNEDGSFSVIIPDTYVNDTIIFSALGYGRKSFPISNLNSTENLTVYLNESVTMLRPVTVKAKPEKIKTFWLGNRYHNGGFFYAGSISAGAAMALLIENKYPSYSEELTFPIIIDQAILRIDANEMGEFKLRVRLLAVDSVTKLPGNDLFDQSLIVSSSIKKGWLTFDLSPYQLKINQPFYLVFEWILNDRDRLALLGMYKEFRAQHPEKFLVDTMMVRGEKIPYNSYQGFRPAVHFGVSPLQFSLEHYECYARTNSFGEWKKAPVILTARIAVNNAK